MMDAFARDRTVSELHAPIAPNQWTGETSCVLGPFVAESVAEHFANQVVDFGQYEPYRQRIFRGESAWFIEVQAA
jgi:hypothetical protein